MDLKIRATSEYKNISLEETFKFIEASAYGLHGAEIPDRLELFG